MRPAASTIRVLSNWKDSAAKLHAWRYELRMVSFHDAAFAHIEVVSESSCRQTASMQRSMRSRPRLGIARQVCGPEEKSEGQQRPPLSRSVWPASVGLSFR